MDTEIEIINEKIGDGCKTILLPTINNSDCYAVYSKECNLNYSDKRLLVDGFAYKHRLYFYKKIKEADNAKILTFIVLNPGYSNHLKQDVLIRYCEEIAKDNDYTAIEVCSIFTLRTIDKIDAISEDAMLNVIRTDLSKNDIVLAYGDEIKRTKKYSNISKENLKKINRVRQIKINELLSFIFNNQKRKGKIYAYSLTANNNPKSLNSYPLTKKNWNVNLIELKYSDIKN